MAKHQDDIYRKEQVPRFAKRKKTRSSSRGGSRSGSGSGPTQSLPPHLSNLSRRKRRSGRRQKQGNKISIAIVLGLVVVMVVYIGILGFSLARKWSGRDAEVAGKPPTEVIPTPSPAPLAAPPENVTDKELVEAINNYKRDQVSSYDVLNKYELIRNTKGEDAAMKQIEARYQATPDLLHLKTGLAKIYFQREEYKKARGLLMELMQVTPRDTQVRELLAECLMKEAHLDAANTAADWVLETDQFSVNALNIQAKVYMQKGNVAGAIKKLQRVIDIDQRNIPAMNSLGMAHMKLENYDRAIRIFDLVLQQEESNSVSFYNLAVCHAHKGNATQAADYLVRGSNQFGNTFVATWLKDPAFEKISNAPAYKAAVKLITGEDEGGLQMNAKVPFIPEIN